MDVEFCATSRCHATFTYQWAHSSHRLAGDNRAYLALLDRFTAEFGTSEAVFCERCHNPLLVFLGMEYGGAEARAYREQGVNCAGCHQIIKGDLEAGNGPTQFREPRHLMPGADRTDQYVRWATAWLIRFSLYKHRADWDGLEFDKCIPCHKVTMPAAYMGGHSLVLGDTVTPWRNLDSNRDCTHCHNQFVSFTEDSASGNLMDHLMPSLNNAFEILVSLPSPEQDPFLLKKYSETFLAGKTQTSLVDKLFFYPLMPNMRQAMNLLKTPPITMSIAGERQVVSGTTMALQVSSKNLTEAHHIPTGLPDVIDFWLQVEVVDSAGRAVFRSGVPDAQGILPAETIRLGTKIYDENGKPILDHRFWRIRRSEGNFIKIGETRKDVFRFVVPLETRLPLRAEAKWQYRRYKPEVVEPIFGEKIAFPILLLSSATWTSQ